MNQNIRLTLYVPREIKEEIFEMAKKIEPRTTGSALGALLLKMGMEQYKQQLLEDQNGQNIEIQ